MICTDSQHLRRLVCILILTATPCLAQEPAPIAPKAPANTPLPVSITRLEDLKRMSCDELQQIYAGAACPGSQPVGFARGEILFLVNMRRPEANKRKANLVWKGKHFNEQGEFINQWVGGRAVRSHVYTAPSWFDNRPSLILEYPEKVPYFGKMRDELREVGPGVYLSVVYDRTSPPVFRGVIGLELTPTKRPWNH
jgi:hypothetical protein